MNTHYHYRELLCIIIYLHNHLVLQRPNHLWRSIILLVITKQSNYGYQISCISLIRTYNRLWYVMYQRNATDIANQYSRSNINSNRTFSNEFRSTIKIGAIHKNVLVQLMMTSWQVMLPAWIFMWETIGYWLSLVDSPHKGPIIKKFHGVFVVDSSNPLNKQFRGRWNETPWLMWRHYYVIDLCGANCRTTQTEAVIGMILIMN